MYKLLEHLTGVRTFAINDKEELALVKDNSFFLKNGVEYVKYYDFPKAMQEIYFSHNFYTNSDEGDGYVFVDGRMLEIGGGVTCCISKEKVAGYKVINEKKEFFIYDINKKSEELIKHRINRQDSFAEGFIFQGLWPSKTLLVKISLINNQIIWQLDLKTLGKYFKKEYEIEKIIGIFNNELLVGCRNTVLLAINPETGEVIYQWQELEKTADSRYPKGKIGNFTCTAILHNEGKVVGCGSENFWEIDLKTRNVVEHDFNQKLKNEHLGSLHPSSPLAMNDDHFIVPATTYYNVNNYENPDPVFTVLLAINKKTFELDWMHNFGESIKDGLRETEAVGNKLYQLDSGGNLFIFEKVK